MVATRTQTKQQQTTQEAPLERILSLLHGYKSYSRGYMACCPAHNESNPSLMIWEDESDGHVGLKCFAGCTRKAICEALGLTESDLYVQDNIYKPRRTHRTLDIYDLAADKSIDVRQMIRLWGITDSHTYTTAKGKTWKNVVRIPYHNLDGTEYSRARIRTALRAKDGSPWEGEGPLIPYGLERLSTTQDFLVIPEGESDCWTLWQWGFPALGIPGATNAKCLQTEHIVFFPPCVYIVKEPADPGKPQAGEKFIKGVSTHLIELGYTGTLYQLDLQASHQVKDPNDLNKKLFAEGRPKDFTSEFQRALEAATLIDTQKTYVRPSESGLPEIIIGEQLRELSRCALAALHKGDQANSTIFVKEGRLVQLARDEKKSPIIRPMGISEVRNALTRTADYFRTKAIPNTNQVKLIPISPPKELAEDILALDPCTWPFPPLAGITEMPIMRPDGSILDTLGYDAATKLYYVANDHMKHCKIPPKPTKEQMRQAVELINACIGEFPYETAADYANTFALLLTLITRYMYAGDVMTALINATKQGTGKSLLAILACILATGRPPAMTSFPEKEEETKKVIDAKVLAGVPIIVFDNIKRPFQSAALDMLTTCRGWYSVRPLGKSQDITVHTQMTVIATGNNIQIDSDQARRCYQIRLVSPVSNPDEREDITIKKLVEHALEHRAELVTALLTVARAWFVAGKPDATNKIARSASSYSDWCNTVGGMLENVGIQGFQENRDELRASANSEEQQMDAFLHAWQNEFGNTYIPASDVVKIIKTASQQAEGSEVHPLLTTLPDYLKTAFFEKEKSVQSCTVSFTKWLARRVKTPYGRDNILLDYRTDTVKCQKEWHVSTGGTGGTGGNSPHYAGEKNFSEASSDAKKGSTEKDNSVYKTGCNTSCTSCTSCKNAGIPCTHSQSANDRNNSPQHPQEENVTKSQNGSTSHFSTNDTFEDENTLPAKESNSPQDESLVCEKEQAELRKLYYQWQAHLLERQRQADWIGTLFWYGGQSGFANGFIAPEEYKRRIVECRESGELLRVRAAANAIRRTLGLEEQ